MNLKIAVIPWNNEGMQNKIFIIDNPKLNKDNRNNPFYDMKKAFEENGDTFQTIDLFENLAEIDYFCFFDLHWDWLYKIVKLGKADRMIYCNAEPPVFNNLNCPEGEGLFASPCLLLTTYRASCMRGNDTYGSV